MDSVNLDPSPAILIESMRDLGYSLETALADIVDNSITAGASTIRIRLDPSHEDPCLGILDDGKGMTRKELLEAMRPGSRSPLDKREAHDLGRFGLGLKTASFSQCRRLTVVSRRDGVTSAAIWDLDYVVEHDKWSVQIPDCLDVIPYADELGSAGTLVLWEKIDRVCDTNDAAAQEEATSRLNDACCHLELVFHRFLAGEKPLRKTKILVNGNELKPLDPFCTRHIATTPGPEEIIRVHDHNVIVQSFTIPHHSKVSKEEWERIGRAGGHVKNQGFYVYRAKRLIISGTWFGLLKQTELTKLARVKIDMPNSLDDYWKIDVKKASAQPPRLIRRRLRQIIDHFVHHSKRVYTARGAKLVSEKHCPAWLRVADKGEVRYEINREHPVIRQALESIDENISRNLRAALRMIEAALPVATIHVDTNDNPNGVVMPVLNREEIKEMVIITYKRLLEHNGDKAMAVQFIRTSEPFASAGSFLEEIIDTLD